MGLTKEERWWAQDQLKERERKIFKNGFKFNCKKEGLKTFKIQMQRIMCM
jgi:hypothetical protein